MNRAELLVTLLVRYGKFGVICDNLLLNIPAITPITRCGKAGWMSAHVLLELRAASACLNVTLPMGFSRKMFRVAVRKDAGCPLEMNVQETAGLLIFEGVS
jgi:hypothetical protein